LTHNSSPDGRAIYGNAESSNHNLLRVKDGLGRIVVENTYQTDIYQSDFDRIVQQRFGNDAYVFRYYDLTKSNLQVAANDLARVSLKPESVALCQTSCEQQPARGQPSGGENWVGVVGGGYLIFPGEIGGPSSGIEGGSWPVSFSPTPGGPSGSGDPAQLNRRRWIEIQMSSDGDGLVASLNPALPVPKQGIKIQSPDGEFTFYAKPGGKSGELALELKQHSKLKELAARHSSSIITLVRTQSEQWRAYPTPALGGAQILPANACSADFAARLEGGQIRFTRGNCHGRVAFAEFGKRQAGWDGLLTSARGATSWSMADNSAQYLGTTWTGDPWSPDTPSCPIPQPLPQPDPLCIAALGSPDSMGPSDPGECSAPWFSQTTVTPAGPDQPTLGCFPSKPGGLPAGVSAPQCPDPNAYGQVVTYPFPYDPQLITQAVVVDQGDQIQKTYYSTSDGKVVRVVNTSSGARVDINFDLKSRLLGWRSAFGDRTCIQYDENSDPVRVTRLPAANKFAAQSVIEQRTSFTSYGRPQTVYNPNSSVLTPIGTVEYDAHYNARALHTIDPQQGDVSYTFKRDAVGRVTRETKPDGAVTLFSYSPVTGAIDQVTWAAGTPIEQRRNIKTNDAGQILRIDESGRPTQQLAVAGDGRLLDLWVILDPGSRPNDVQHTHFTYDAAGLLQSVARPNERDEFVWNPRGQLGAMSREGRMPDGTVQKRISCFGYLNEHLLESVDGEGRRVTLERDANGDAVRVYRGNVPTVNVNGGAGWCTSELPAGAQPVHELFIELTRDAASGGLVQQVSNGPASVGPERMPQTESWNYDGFGRPVEMTLSDGTLRRIGYDARNQIAWTALYSRGAMPLPTAVAELTPDPDADPSVLAVTFFDYDTRGRLRVERSRHFVRSATGSISDAGTSGWLATGINHDDVANTVQIVRPDGTSSTYAFDALGRISTATLPDGSVVAHTYGDHGLVHSSSVAAPISPTGHLGSVSHLTTYGKITRIDGLDGQNIYQATYDGVGRLNQATEYGRTLQFTWSGFDEVVKIGRVGANGVVSPWESFQYDRNGSPVLLQDGLGHTTQWSRDPTGRIDTVTYPDGASTILQYFEGTNLLRTRFDRQRDQQVYTYDAYGECREVRGAHRGPAGLIETTLDFFRGPLGIVAASSRTTTAGVLTGEVKSEFQRDSLGLIVTEWSNLFDEPIRYTRDPENRRLAIQAGSNDIAFASDLLGRLGSVALDGVPQGTWTYQGVGPAATLLYGNGLIEQRSYDNSARLRSRTFTTPNSANIAQQQIDWSVDGTPARIDESFSGAPGDSAVWLDDDYGRLSSAGFGSANPAAAGSSSVTSNQIAAWLRSPGFVVENFAYDPADNFTAIDRGGSGPAPRVRPSVGADNRYLNWNGPLISDAEGRLVSAPRGGDLAYDGLGRLIAASDGAQNWKFYYDAFGRLSGWDESSSKIRFQWATDRIVREQAHVDGQTSSVLYLPGEGLGPLATVAGNATSYDHYGLGERLAFATDGIGRVAERYQWSAYALPSFLKGNGSPTAASEIGNRMLLAGQPYIPGLHLHRQGLRWYAPDFGRFTTPNPALFADGPNLFAYAGAQPIMFIDPAGLDKENAGQSGATQSSPALQLDELAYFPQGPLSLRYSLAQQSRPDEPGAAESTSNILRYILGPGHEGPDADTMAAAVRAAIANGVSRAAVDLGRLVLLPQTYGGPPETIPPNLRDFLGESYSTIHIPYPEGVPPTVTRTFEFASGAVANLLLTYGLAEIAELGALADAAEVTGARVATDVPLGPPLTARSAVPLEAPEVGGTATVYAYPAHFSVEVRYGTEALHTELLPVGRGTVVLERESAEGAELSVDISLPDAPGALQYQRSQLGPSNIPFDTWRYSCATHCAEVLQEGGIVDVPGETRAFVRWFKGQIGK
jgi:RHS repeat-associated protein